MPNQLLLLEDVDNLGRSGDLVTVKPGYSRNFLLPQKKAVIASNNTLRLRAKLQEERAQRAHVDRTEAEAIAEKINGKVYNVVVKVDPEGNLYGSVAAVDVVRILQEDGITIEKRHVVLPQPIKKVGTHAVRLKLQEDVPASIVLEIASDAQPTQLPSA